MAALIKDQSVLPDSDLESNYKIKALNEQATINERIPCPKRPMIAIVPRTATPAIHKKRCSRRIISVTGRSKGLLRRIWGSHFWPKSPSEISESLSIARTRCGRAQADDSFGRSGLKRGWWWPSLILRRCCPEESIKSGLTSVVMTDESLFHLSLKRFSRLEGTLRSNLNIN